MLLWFPPSTALDIVGDRDIEEWTVILTASIRQATGLQPEHILSVQAGSGSMLSNLTLTDLPSSLLVKRVVELGELCVDFRSFSECASLEPQQVGAATCRPAWGQLAIAGVAGMIAALLSFALCFWADRRCRHHPKHKLPAVASAGALPDRFLPPMYEPVHSRGPMAVRLYDMADAADRARMGSMPNSLPRPYHTTDSRELSFNSIGLPAATYRSSTHFEEGAGKYPSLQFSDLSNVSPHSTMSSMRSVDGESGGYFNRPTEKDLARKRRTFLKELVPSASAHNGSQRRPVLSLDVDVEDCDEMQLIPESPVPQPTAGGNDSMGSSHDLTHARVIEFAEEASAPDSPLPEVPSYGFGDFQQLDASADNQTEDTDGTVLTIPSRRHSIAVHTSSTTKPDDPLPPLPPRHVQEDSATSDTDLPPKVRPRSISLTGKSSSKPKVVPRTRRRKGRSRQVTQGPPHSHNETES